MSSGSAEPREANDRAGHQRVAGPKVSIVLPTYNDARYLRQSIDSCLGQTYSNIELIIVDDGSLDETASIVASYTDARIKYVRHDINRGLPRALNTGFAQTTGEFLTWTSSDNFYVPDAIGTMLDFFGSHSDVDFIYADFYLIDEENRVMGLVKVGPVEELMYHNSVGACFLYRRHVYAAVGDFSPRLPLAEDYAYWLCVSKSFRMERLTGIPLYYYRKHARSLSSTYDRAKECKLNDQARWYAFAEEARANRHWRAKLRKIAAFEYLYVGDLTAATRNILSAVFNDPTCLGDRMVLAMLLEFFLGKKTVEAARRIRHNLTEWWKRKA